MKKNRNRSIWVYTADDTLACRCDYSLGKSTFYENEHLRRCHFAAAPGACECDYSLGKSAFYEHEPKHVLRKFAGTIFVDHYNPYVQVTIF